MPFAFEKLVVYQKALDFADQICRNTEQFSRGYGFLVNQLNRAALSIAANIAEGNGRFTKRDRRHFFGIARGSAQECAPLLELALRRGLLTCDSHTILKNQLEEVARMLSGLIKLEDRGRSTAAIQSGHPQRNSIPVRLFDNKHDGAKGKRCDR